MSWLTTLQLALHALWRNRLRAALTALGVIIGVASVITMLSIGAGAQQRVAETLASLGTNMLVIKPGSLSRGGVRRGAGGQINLTLDDAEAVSRLPDLIGAAPSIRASGQVRSRMNNWGTVIEGVTADYAVVHNWTLEVGSFITDQQVAGATQVCVLGQTAARELFGISNPVDETLVVKGGPCRVVGVLEPKGVTAWGSDQDDVVFMPVTTVQRKLLGVNYVHRIDVAVPSREKTDPVLQDINVLLRSRHRLSEEQPDDFRAYNRAELAQSSEESARVFTWLLGSIAFVSLLVGGIGIMNIMLVSVSERTREIGIRMALGARQRDILWQFLLEAAVLSGVGGVIGILLGVGSAAAVALFSALPISITLTSVVVAFFFAGFIGVFFGIHPARKAARFAPIVALRHE